MVWILFEKPKSYCKPWEKPFRAGVFLLYVNDMKSAITDCDFRLYADDTCVLFNNENVSSIEKHVNVDFNGLCERFIGNKLSVQLREDKTKCILFKKGKKK